MVKLPEMMSREEFLDIRLLLNGVSACYSVHAR